MERPTVGRSVSPAVLVGAAVAAATFLAFAPALKGGFFILDDPQFITENPSIHGLSAGHLRAMFSFNQFGGAFHPVSLLTYALDYAAWGPDPRGFHLTNLLLHSLHAFLLYLLVLRVLSLAAPAFGKEEAGAPARWLSAAAALFYSIHPLRVETIAWIVGRPYVLAGLFSTASVLAYLQARGQPESGSGRLGWRAASLLAYALSLGSYGVVATLPVILLVLDGYPLRRFERDPTGRGEGALAVLLEKAPYFALALASVGCAMYGRTQHGRFISLEQFDLGARAAQALFGAVFYLEKMLVPLRLSFCYSVASPAALHPFDMLVAPRTLGFAVITAFAWWARRSWPAVPAVWAGYLAMYLPFSGIAKHDVLEQVASDRWSHPALACWSFLAAGGLALAWRHARASGADAARRILAPAAGVLLMLFVLTWRHTARWKTSERFLKHCVSVDPVNYLCHKSLGFALIKERRWAEAASHSLEAQRIKPPADVEVFLNLCRALAALDRGAEGEPYCVRAREINASYPSFFAERHFVNGYEASRQGRLDDALVETRMAVALKPDFPGARFNLGYLSGLAGRLGDAEAHYREAIRLSPAAANAYLNLGLLLSGQKRSAEAAPFCRRAYELDPKSVSPDCRRAP